jgi:hypothetical protein
MSYMWLDTKYISLASFRLRNYKRKGPTSWNFSCPICGDSKDDKRKARGYVFPAKGKLLFYCHKCTVVKDVPRFLQEIDKGLYDEYVKEKLVSNYQSQEDTELTDFVNKMKPPAFATTNSMSKLKKISSLKPENPAKLYVQGRQIPAPFHYKLFLCLAFKDWVNDIIPEKFESIASDEPRLIIPFLDKDDNMFGFQGRSFRANTNLRYITIMLDESKPKLFGLDMLNTKEHIYVVEGPIDSMFIPNCIASAGGDLSTDLRDVTDDPSNITVVYDNEPRHPDTVKKIQKAIDLGYNVCLWPDTVKQKDINDMILSGYTSQKLVDIIKNNTYKGLEAKLGLAMWKRC